jgi:type IV secretion system protein VirB10
MTTNNPQALAGAAPAEGIVEIRRSVIIAILLVIGLFAGLVLWLMRSSHPIIAPATAQSLSTLHSTDVSTLDQNAAKHTDALPAPPPVPVYRPQSRPALDTSLIDAAQPPAQVARPAHDAESTSTASGSSPSSAANDAAVRRQQEIEAARNSDMDVKLSDRDPADREARVDVPPIVAAQPLTTQADAESSAPTGPVIQRGMIIPASLYTPIDSTIPGVVTAEIRQDVFDATHRVLVIPRGSKLIGSYESAMGQGQARLFVGFDSIKLPNLRTIDLGSMRGVDLNGVSGLGGKVDFHTGRLFANVLLLSVLAAGAELAQPRTNGCGSYGCQESAGQAIGSAVGSNIADAATRTYDRTLSQAPTMHVPAGYVLDVMVERDLSLEVYQE